MNTQTIHYLTQEELKRLLSVITSKRDRAIILLAYAYGLRASEIGELQRDDIDWERLRIRIRRKKGSISSEYPFPPPSKQHVATALKSYLRTRKDQSPMLFRSKCGLAITRKGLYHLMQKYGEKANLPKEKRKFHVLKHSIATHLIDAGAEIMFVKDWLGHKNIQNTLVYAQLVGRTRDEQARQVFSSSKIV